MRKERKKQTIEQGKLSIIMVTSAAGGYKTQAPPATTATMTATALAAFAPACTLIATAPELLPPALALALLAYGPVYVVAAFGIVLILPSRTDLVLEPVKPPGTPVLIPVGGPVVGLAAVMPCE